MVPKDLKAIASRIRQRAGSLRDKLVELGYHEANVDFFDTLHIYPPTGISVEEIRSVAVERELNFRYYTDNSIGIALDETTGVDDLNRIVEVFATAVRKYAGLISEETIGADGIHRKFLRTDNFMNLILFRRYRCETEMMRYIKTSGKKGFFTHTWYDPIGFLYHEA